MVDIYNKYKPLSWIWNTIWNTYQDQQGLVHSKAALGIGKEKPWILLTQMRIQTLGSKTPP
jgi:hypothetical protein